MSSRVYALERVADRRHARAMGRGLSEAAAAGLVALFLRGWLTRHGERVSVGEARYARALLAGYEVEL